MIATMPAELQASRRDATLILTISHPGAKNALHSDMYAAAIETLSTAERDDSIRAVVLTGADGFFSSGASPAQLLERRARGQAEQAAPIDSLHGWIEAIRDCPKPVIAAVDGTAADAGFALALACDMMIAGASATFIMACARLGLTPDGGASWFLAQALPRQLATEMLVEGKPVTAARLHALGVVNKIVADGSALDNALAWADELATASPHAVERIKSLMRDAQANSLTQHFDAEKQCFIESLQHRDALEGLTAFLEQRPPHYK